MNRSINKEVDVLSFYFSGGGRTRCFPKKIELEGRQLDFLESGLRCLVKRGQSFIQIFNMTDGRRAYRLRFEPENRTWTLLSTRAL